MSLEKNNEGIIQNVDKNVSYSYPSKMHTSHFQDQSNTVLALPQTQLDHGMFSGWADNMPERAQCTFFLHLCATFSFYKR